MVPAPPDSVHGAALAAALRPWYLANARALPWRAPPGSTTRPDPYPVWISETVLQQTTVAVGKVRVPAFLERFPTLQSLAEASEEDVMDAWAGLGYYRRAKNLHASARLAWTTWGRFPDEERHLATLPGVGPYTAAAVAAFAGGHRAVVLDTNVERVLARVHACPIPLPAARRWLFQAADAATPDVEAGDHAQALMDLAQSLCKPKQPACLLCPLRALCRAAAQGNPEAYPARAPRKAKPRRVGMCAVAFTQDGGVWVERRPPTGLLPSTIGLPGGSWLGEGQDPDRLFPASAPWAQAGVVKHTFAHFHLELEVWWAVVPNGQPWSDRLEKRTVSANVEAGMSSLFAKAYGLAWDALCKTRV
jgi:A/G-specific adenine glycosylase